MGDLTKTFDKIEYTIICRAQNQFADVLATLASMVEIPERVWARPLEIKQSYKEVHKGKTEASVMTIEDEEVLWYYDIMKFLKLGAYPDGADKRERRSIRMMATQSILRRGQLYRRSYDGICLHCLKKEAAKKVMEKIHQEICGPHMNERMLAKKILRMGYYWNTIEIDCVDYVKSCQNCQTHANLSHVLPRKLYSMTFLWPFSIWGIDVIGRIDLKVSNGNEYILVAIDYFTKWVEAASYSVLKAKYAAQFLENNIICQFRVSQEIISNNGSHFKGEVQGSWKNMALSIKSLHRINHKLMGP